MAIKIKIAVNKIPKERLFKGKKDTYLDAVLVEKPDAYQNDGFIAMDVTKAEREAGTRGAIIGNWKYLGGKKAVPQKPARAMEDGDEEIPF